MARRAKASPEVPAQQNDQQNDQQHGAERGPDVVADGRAEHGEEQPQHQDQQQQIDDGHGEEPTLLARVLATLERVDRLLSALELEHNPPAFVPRTAPKRRPGLAPCGHPYIGFMSLRDANGSFWSCGTCAATLADYDGCRPLCPERGPHNGCKCIAERLGLPFASDSWCECPCHLPVSGT